MVKTVYIDPDRFSHRKSYFCYTVYAMLHQAAELVFLEYSAKEYL